MQGAGLYTQMLYVFGFSFPFRTPHLGETLYGIEWIQSLGCVWFYFQRCIPFWSKENDLESSFPWSPTKIFWQEGSILPHQCVKIHTHETSPGLPHYFFFFSSYLVEVEVGDWVWGLKILPKDIHLLLWIHMWTCPHSYYHSTRTRSLIGIIKSWTRELHLCIFAA